MKALTALLMLTGAVGIGYLAYKNMTEKKENPDAFTEKEAPKKSGKLHRASMYTVGAIKTTADKVSEGVKEIVSEDMVKKGEETIELIKESGESFKEQVKETTTNLCGRIKETSDNVKEQVKEAGENIRDELKETGIKISDELRETGENIKGDLKEIKNLVTSINTMPTETVNESNELDKDIPDIEIEFLDDNGYSLFEDVGTSEQL